MPIYRKIITAEELLCCADCEFRSRYKMLAMKHTRIIIIIINIIIVKEMGPSESHNVQGPSESHNVHAFYVIITISKAIFKQTFLIVAMNSIWKSRKYHYYFYYYYY
jgi:hypothetical protein